MYKDVGQRYAQYVNRSRERSGTLWEGRFHSCLVQDEVYLLRCYRYVEMNPVRAGLVPRPRAYPWSSHRYNAEGDASELVTPHPVYRALGVDSDERRSAYRALFEVDDGPVAFDEIRVATRRNFVLGDASFRRRMGASFGRPESSIYA
jgi:putative transposase